MKSGFTFGPKCSWDFDMHVEKIPALKDATRRRTTFTVPGRNGDLHCTENAFTNYQQSYECYFHSERPAPEQAHAIKSWLHSTGAYQRLEDTYDPKYYRMATFVGPLDIENHLNKYGRCTVYFDCAPQCFLKSGEHATVLSASGSIYNHTNFTALPIIYVYGKGAGTVTVGGVKVQIKDMTDQLIFDCEMQNAYRQVGQGTPENKNSSIYAPVYPTLLPGDNVVSFTGGVTKIEIIPRWWEL